MAKVGVLTFSDGRDFVHEGAGVGAFAREVENAPVEEILSRYGSNHIHAIPGDRVEELRAVCRLLDVDYDGFGSARGST